MFEIAPHGKTIILVMDRDQKEGKGHVRITPEAAPAILSKLERLTKHYAHEDEMPAEDFALGHTRNKLYVDTKDGAVLIVCDHPPNVLDSMDRCHAYLDLSVARKLIIPIRQGLGLAHPVRKRSRPQPTAPGATVRKRTRKTL